MTIQFLLNISPLIIAAIALIVPVVITYMTSKMNFKHDIENQQLLHDQAIKDKQREHYNQIVEDYIRQTSAYIDNMFSNDYKSRYKNAYLLSMYNFPQPARDLAKKIDDMIGNAPPNVIEKELIILIDQLSIHVINSDNV